MINTLASNSCASINMRISRLALTLSVITIILIIAPSMVFAGDDMRKVSLHEALSLATTQSSTVLASGYARDAGIGDAATARGSLLPRIYMEERYMRTDNPTYAFSSKLSEGRFTSSDFSISSLNNPHALNDFQTAVGFEQALFAPQAALGLKIAKNESSALEADLARSREEAAYRAALSYISVQTSRAFVIAATKAKEDAEEARRVAGLRFDAGMGLMSDVFRTDVAIKAAEERLMRALAMNSNAQRSLGLALAYDGMVDIAGPIEPGVIDKVDLYITAANGRSDIRAASIREKNADNAIKLAQAKFLPTMGLSGEYQMNDHATAFGDEGKSFMLGVALKWDILSGGSTLGEVHAAESRAKEASSKLDGARQEAAYRVYEAYSNIQTAQSSVALAEATQKLAEEGRRLIMQRYENGLSTLVEMLDAQSMLDNARASLAQKQAELLSAIAALMLSSSLDIETMIKQGAM